MKTLWCKNQENPSDRISHAWAPLIDTIFRIAVIDTFSRMDGNRWNFCSLGYCIASSVQENFCLVFSIASSVKKILANKIVSLYLIFFSKIVYLYRLNPYIFEYRCPSLCIVNTTDLSNQDSWGPDSPRLSAMFPKMFKKLKYNLMGLKTHFFYLLSIPNIFWDAKNVSTCGSIGSETVFSLVKKIIIISWFILSYFKLKLEIAKIILHLANYELH